MTLWPALLVLAVAAPTTACSAEAPPSPSPETTPQAAVPLPPARAQHPAEPADPDWARAARTKMVREHLAARDIRSSHVLRAMQTVLRHHFVPTGSEKLAYIDRPLRIGHGQTISQPYIVALMTQLVGAKPGMKALDVGTGSGYQAAVLAEIVDHVYGIEIVCPLAEQSKGRLERLGYTNATVRCGDGYRGWPEHAPFDAIILAAAPDHVPQPLIDQLAPGGRLVLPVGRGVSKMTVIQKNADGTVHRRAGIEVLFVPMTGEAQKPAPVAAPTTSDPTR